MQILRQKLTRNNRNLPHLLKYLPLQPLEDLTYLLHHPDQLEVQVMVPVATAPQMNKNLQLSKFIVQIAHVRVLHRVHANAHAHRHHHHLQHHHHRVYVCHHALHYVHLHHHALHLALSHNHHLVWFPVLLLVIVVLFLYLLIQVLIAI